MTVRHVLGDCGEWLRLPLFLLVCLLSPTVGAASTSTSGALQVYFVDVEGGQSTLFVTPTHESLLIDTGWPGNNGRDADRIVAIAKRAGLGRIDYVLLTHYHDDHVGGVSQLVARIPVGTFIDHGPNRELDGGVTQHGYDAYQGVLATGRAKRLEAHPGDVLPIKGMRVTVVSNDGATISRPMPGGGQPNAFCAASEVRPTDRTENARSLGVAITFGRLRLLDLGDLTWDKERQLMCPNNPLGAVDVLVVSHHGWYQSSSPALVYAVAPRAAIMDNGETKGGSTPTLVTLAQHPGLPNVWQLHYSEEGAERNAAAGNIANLQGPDRGHFLRLTGSEDGSFAIFNERTGATVPYPPRDRAGATPAP